MTTHAFLRMGTLASVLLLGASASAAGQGTRDFEAGAFVGHSRFYTNPPDRLAVFREGDAHLVVRNGKFEDALTAGVNAGLRFGERYGLGATLSWTPTRLVATHGLSEMQGQVDVNAFAYGLTFHHHWPTPSRVHPFLGIGLGAETALYEPEGWSSRTDLVASLSGGAEMTLREALSLRLDARQNLTTFESMIEGEDDKLRSHLVVSAGVNFRRAR